MAPSNIYPIFSVTRIENPKRLYAVPLLGILIKAVMCIPVLLYLVVVGIIAGATSFINSFRVVAGGDYWETAYKYNLGMIRLSTKLSLFFFGLTDKYPGFSLTIDDPLLSLAMDKPQKPSRVFAIPFIGGIIRWIFLIPYVIYLYIVERAAWLGTVGSSFVVLSQARYPESTYELARDYTRISAASGAYMSGLSDSYPSFWISMNHKDIKIALLIAAIVISLLDLVSDRGERNIFSPTNYETSLPR